MPARAEAPADNNAVTLMGYRQALRKDPASAEAAAKALVRFGPKAAEALPELVAALRYDEPATAEAVIQAFTAIGPAAVNPLMKSLSDSNFLARQRAATALGTLGPQAGRAAPMLTDMLMDASFEVRTAAEKALGQLGEAGVSAVSAALRREKGPNRKIYIDVLPPMGPKAVPVLVSVLTKDDIAALRAAAASALREMGPSAAEAVPGLVRALSDLQEVVRAESVDALGAIGPGSRSALGALLIVSQTDQDALVRQKAAQAIQKIGPGDRSSLPALTGALRHEKPEIRAAALLLLGRCDVPMAEIQMPLQTALGDPDPKMRAQAVMAISELSKGSASALSTYRIALKDPASEVKEAAITGLGKMTESKTEAASELMRVFNDPDAVLRRKTIAALAALGPEGIPGLGLALKDSFSVLADEAGNSLVKMGPEAQAELERLAAGFDPVQKKRAEALLKRMQPKTSAKPLKKKK